MEEGGSQGSHLIGKVRVNSWREGEGPRSYVRGLQGVYTEVPAELAGPHTCTYSGPHGGGQIIN